MPHLRLMPQPDKRGQRQGGLKLQVETGQAAAVPAQGALPQVAHVAQLRRGAGVAHGFREGHEVVVQQPLYELAAAQQVGGFLVGAEVLRGAGQVLEQPVGKGGLRAGRGEGPQLILLNAEGEVALPNADAGFLIGLQGLHHSGDALPEVEQQGPVLLAPVAELELQEGVLQGGAPVGLGLADALGELGGSGPLCFE